ncbi:hypothetical protein ACOSQ2_028404 [Xanthoceras sorbifolium]
MAANVVQVRNVIRVSPRPNSNSTGSTTESTLPLTYFDTFWLKFPPVERLFFYQLTDITHHLFDSVILPSLTRALSLSLLHYLPLAGKIKWSLQAPKPAIFYSPDDAVSVTVAESTADNFDRLSSDDVYEAIEVRPLTPELHTSDDFADLISFQITLFPNKGFSIGVSTHHAIFDGKSSTTFIKSWAYLCKSQSNNEEQSLLLELTPSFDRTVIKDPAGADVSFVQKWFGLGGQYSSTPNSRSLKVFPSIGTVKNWVRATFVLTRDDFKKLRDRVHEHEVRESKKLHLSTFVLTCAYVFVCMVKARGGDGDRQVLLGFTADYRARLDPPIPSNYFGNCVGTAVVFAKARDFMEENAVAVAAEKLSEAIKGLESKGAVEGLEEILALYKTIKPGEIQGLGTAGSARFGVYGTDFGWGRPKKVEIVSVDRTGSVALAESRSGDGGVEVGLVLEKHEMEAFASLFNQGLN